MAGMRRLACAVALAACSSSATPALMQHEITAAGDLLTSDGRLREPGWARRQLLSWDPNRVHDRTRLRQWDFFTVESDAAAVNFTLADLGFAQVGSVGLVDFATSAMHSASVFKAAEDTLSLSSAVDGSAALTVSGASGPALAFAGSPTGSQITVEIGASLLGEAASGALTLTRGGDEYLSLATPFSGDAHQFFFEQKIPGMRASGTITVGAKSYTFDAAPAVMDWGRGQWPQTVTWRWAAASGSAGARRVALNLGEGFGDDHNGTENLLVVDGVAQKLARVDWAHVASDPLADWTFTARDGRVSLTLHPAAKETGGLDFGTRYSRLQKGYGHLDGTVVLDDGTRLDVDLTGFAEEEQLAW
jgi:hypothetical protein